MATDSTRMFLTERTITAGDLTAADTVKLGGTWHTLDSVYSDVGTFSSRFGTPTLSERELLRMVKLCTRTTAGPKGRTLSMGPHPSYRTLPAMADWVPAYAFLLWQREQAETPRVVVLAIDADLPFHDGDNSGRELVVLLAHEPVTILTAE